MFEFWLTIQMVTWLIFAGPIRVLVNIYHFRIEHRSLSVGTCWRGGSVPLRRHSLQISWANKERERERGSIDKARLHKNWGADEFKWRAVSNFFPWWGITYTVYIQCKAQCKNIGDWKSCKKIRWKNSIKKFTQKIRPWLSASFLLENFLARFFEPIFYREFFHQIFS